MGDTPGMEELAGPATVDQRAHLRGWLSVGMAEDHLQILDQAGITLGSLFIGRCN